MDKTDALEKIKKQINVQDETSDTLLLDLIWHYTAIALAQSNRTQDRMTDTLEKIIQYAVISAYNRRGEEGISESDINSQSYSYKDIEEKMFDDILSSGLRIPDF